MTRPQRKNECSRCKWEAGTIAGLEKHLVVEHEMRAAQAAREAAHVFPTAGVLPDAPVVVPEPLLDKMLKDYAAQEVRVEREQWEAAADAEAKGMRQERRRIARLLEDCARQIRQGDVAALRETA